MYVVIPFDEVLKYCDDPIYPHLAKLIATSFKPSDYKEERIFRSSSLEETNSEEAEHTKPSTSRSPSNPQIFSSSKSPYPPAQNPTSPSRFSESTSSNNRLSSTSNNLTLPLRLSNSSLEKTKSEYSRPASPNPSSKTTPKSPPSPSRTPTLSFENSVSPPKSPSKLSFSQIKKHFQKSRPQSFTEDLVRKPADFESNLYSPQSLSPSPQVSKLSFRSFSNRLSKRLHQSSSFATDDEKKVSNEKQLSGNSGIRMSSSVRDSKRIMQNNRNLDEGAVSNPLKDLTHINLNEPIKQHNANAVKLVQNVSEFAQALGDAMEKHAGNVRRVVDDFRSRSGESRGDSGGMRRVWESLLRQVEADAAAHLDLAAVLQQQLSRPALEGCFQRKVQHRKIFMHREAYDQVVGKAEEKLQRTRVTYKRAYGALLESDGTMDTELRRTYLEAHNAYVLQLKATNAITERYQNQCLPGLMAEIAEIYDELCTLACNCVSGISDAAGERIVEQGKRYQSLSREVKAVNSQADLQLLARNLATVAAPRKPSRRLFVSPSPPEQATAERISSVPQLRDELVPTGNNSLQIAEDDLRSESDRISQEIAHLQDALSTLNRMQRKSIEGNLYTKVSELQEEISMKRFDLGVAQLQLAAIEAQKELFNGEGAQPDGSGNRKMSNGSTGSTKHKWLRAFKSLKTTPTTPPPGEKTRHSMYHAVSTVIARRNLEAEAVITEGPGGHAWREYTYKKITPCDACGQVLRGHARQGLRCRGCKANAHADCIANIQPANCPSLQPKRTPGIPLLRRQKSTAQVVDETPSSEHNVDVIYQVLKQAGEIRGSVTNSPPTPPTADHLSGATARNASQPCSSSTSAPHSPQRRRERLNLRMKSLSLDSPEGSAHVRHRPRDYHTGGPRESTPPRRSDSGSMNRLSAPCSPGQSYGVNKHLRSAIRMSSVELPDENEKSYSSASTSPCPSPHSNQLLPSNKRVIPPNNLYVVLYNFEARQRDELDLKAGYKVTVIDKTDKDWWNGKCLGGRAGYFPSTYVMKIESGQKTLQVTRNLQLAEATLLRDQIVIQVSEEVDGVAMIRCAADVRTTGQNTKDGEVRFKEVRCPLKYLQEV